MMKLQWSQQEGYGYYPAEGAIYDNGYYDAYVEHGKTEKAKKVNRARVALVNKYFPVQDVVDVGIGCGQFIMMRDEDTGPKTFGYDINPKAIRWLVDNGIWWDPYQKHAPAVTLWDTLECMRYPGNLLMHQPANSVAFVSIPIFNGKDDILSSGFMKPHEPYHFFTADGLVIFMYRLGYRVIEHNKMEEELGCPRIQTFVFKKLP
ncbi:MAG: hypothetical protein GTN93_21475 [Anaerolineae bacterium]|nr:hypothetical protein [Anaerolineae bacterium]